MCVKSKKQDAELCVTFKWLEIIEIKRQWFSNQGSGSSKGISWTLKIITSKEILNSQRYSFNLIPDSNICSPPLSLLGPRYIGQMSGVL